MRRWQVVLVVSTVLAAPLMYYCALAGAVPCGDRGAVPCEGAQDRFSVAFEILIWPWLAAVAASLGVVVAALWRLVTRRRRREPPLRTAP